MITRKLIEELRGEKYRKQINQFSAVLLVIFVAFFGFDVWKQKQNQVVESSGSGEATTLQIVDDVFIGQAMIGGEQTNATEVVVNRLEIKPENTEEIAEITDEPITGSAEIPIAVSTNTPAPSSTTFSTNVSAPTSTSVSGTEEAGQIYYVVVSANLRPCPYVSNDCAVTGSLRKGTSITVISEVQGDAFDGSTLWYSIEYDGQTSYVHSALVSPLPPTP